MRLDREHAHALDAGDALAAWHDRFILPREVASGRELVYLCGHSLGAQPVLATEYVEDVMRDWRSLGVEGHFTGRHPWLTYHERLAPALATLVGAEPAEVIAMNTLTANLHLMLVSFYRPSGTRRALLMERSALSLRSPRRRIAGALSRPRPGAGPDRDRAARRRRPACEPKTSSRRSSARERGSPRSCCRASST